MSLFTTWDGSISTESTNEFLTELSSLHVSHLFGAEAAGRNLLASIASGDFPTVCNLDLDVRPFSPLDAYHLGQVHAFFKKRVDLDIGVDRRAVALQKFKESEQLCLETNQIFRSWGAGRFQFRPAVEAVLHSATRKISTVLGDLPSLEEIRLAFGPGATTQIPKRKACAKVKLSQPPACSDTLLPMAGQLLEELPHLVSFPDGAEAATVDVIVEPGRLDFVPKSAKTDRGIMVEPWLNGILQNGLGRYIAKRLKRIGIDLKDQSRNKRLARIGSVTGALATLDLSSASDTVATELVAHLLPLDWFLLLSRVRTGSCVYQDEVWRLEKFSSMGNGFTFPLETLIFWAITSAACEGDLREGEEVTAYGDDIICPARKAEFVMSVLRDLGFMINKDKSFWEGPFRESCGGDYLSGIDIRPCFIKGPMTGHDAFRLHNFYVRSGLDDFAQFVRKHISDDLAIYGPEGFGDGHLLGDWEPVRKKTHAQRGFGGATFETWTFTKREFKARLPGDRVLPLYSIYTREGAIDPLDEASERRLSLVSRGVTTPNILDTCLFMDRSFDAWIRDHANMEVPDFYEAQAQRFTKKGVPVNYLPGRLGCKLVSIYTFER